MKMKILNAFCLGLLVFSFASCKKNTDPDTTLNRGGAGGENGKGFNSGADDFAQGGPLINNPLNDDSLSLRNPNLAGFSDPENVIRPFDPVFFGFDQYNLAAAERPKVEEVADFMKSSPKASVIIEGYCDWKGTPEYNKSLGDRRASTVKKYLVDLGCDASRIDVISIGDHNSVPNASSSEAKADRRAQFMILKNNN
jgi:peptidoglycan-associated lipoprotein|tara:strand:- start:117 stop:707 length:591 start_codon:yes stop_codon:yes gene_type:complete